MGIYRIAEKPSQGKRHASHYCCEMRQGQVFHKTEHEKRGENVSQNVKLIVDSFRHHSIGVERHQVKQELQWVEETRLHSSDESIPRESERIPKRQYAFVNGRSGEVVP